MNDPVWKDVTDSWNIREGGERYVRTIDDDCWISVLYRLTGFGYHEWETAICFRANEHEERKCYIIKGDRREELKNMPKEELMTWYNKNIEGNRNSYETIMKMLENDNG